MRQETSVKGANCFHWLSLSFVFFLFLFVTETFQRVAATDGRKAEKFFALQLRRHQPEDMPPMRAAQTGASMVKHPSCSLVTMKRILREHREID
jgi:hypothetical protein